MTLNVKSRWTAFGIHLLISILILAALLSLIFFVWFPYDLIFAGGLDGLKILMGVDLILGPLLTLIVYVQGKKGLKFDLIVIALVQIGCLVGGLWLVYNERPLVQVLADDGVHLLAASDFRHYNLEPKELPGRNPKNVMLDLPDDRSSWGTIKFTSELVDEKPFTFRTELYLPMQNVSEKDFLQRIEIIQEPMSDAELKRLSGLEQSECQWVPIYSKHISGYACTNQINGVIRLSESKVW